VRTHTKIGEIASGIPPTDAKAFLFFINITRTFGHLSCTDFEQF